MEESNSKKSIWIFCLVFLICLLPNCWGLYYQMYLKDNVTITTAYIDDATYSEDEKYFINLEYYSNAYSNGIECFGARWDYYTDTSIPDKKEDGSYGDKYTYSSGVQFKNGYTYSKYADTNNWNYSYSAFKMNDCTFYNTSNGVSFDATNSLEDMNHWVYDIDGQLCLIEEKGNINEYKTLWVDRGTKYDTSMLLCDLYDVVKSLPDGEQVITIDLSRYYNVFLFDGKEFDKGTPATTENWVFVNVYIYKTSNGLVSAKQSMFKSYMGNPEWSLYGTASENYWQANVEYNLTLKDFTFTYENGGYYLKLQTSCIDYLKEFKNMRLLVNLDIDKIYLGADKLNIEGFSSNAFGGLKIDTINLTSDSPCTFKVFDKKLNIQHSDNITLEYLEVA